MTITKTVPELERALAQCLAGIKPADEAVMEEARQRQAQLAKPPGSLGKLEDISIRLSGMTGRVHNKMDRCRIIVLCADNGVVAEGVACAPQSVTLAQTLNLTRGKTLIVIAHRLGTVADADNIVVINEGRIAGQGRQEELLKQCPLYAQMWNTYLGTRDGKEE